MKIVKYPHPALRYVSRPLTAIDEKVRTQAAKMLDLMYEARGLGLAANQVALPYQLIVLNLPNNDREGEVDRVFINPEILERKGTLEDEEGCLSFPDLYAKVRRAKTIKARAYNLKGEPLEVTVSDLTARLWQHEVDHLNGILFIDKMGPIAKLACRGAVKDFEREFHRAQERGEIPPETEIKQLLDALAAGA
jgi:peptide deformylase